MFPSLSIYLTLGGRRDGRELPGVQQDQKKKFIHAADHPSHLLSTKQLCHELRPHNNKDYEVSTT